MRCVTRFAAMAAVVLMASGCATGRISNPTLERLGPPGEPAEDHEENVYNWRGGDHPDASRPALQPEFTCCETAFSIRGNPRVIGRANVVVNGVSEVHIAIEVNVRATCTRQMAEGEGTDRPVLPCVLTFLNVSPTTQAAFSRHPGGQAMSPGAERVWWTAKVEQCDGRDYNARVTIVYIARYPFAGVPRVATGEPPSQVVLRLDPKANAGRPHEITLSLSQLNDRRPLQVRLTHRPL